MWFVVLSGPNPFLILMRMVSFVREDLFCLLWVEYCGVEDSFTPKITVTLVIWCKCDIPNDRCSKYDFHEERATAAFSAFMGYFEGKSTNLNFFSCVELCIIDECIASKKNKWNHSGWFDPVFLFSLKKKKNIFFTFQKQNECFSTVYWCLIFKSSFHNTCHIFSSFRHRVWLALVSAIFCYITRSHQ